MDFPCIEMSTMGQTSCAGANRRPLGTGILGPADGAAGVIVALNFHGLLSCMPMALALTLSGLLSCLSSLLMPVPLRAHPEECQVTRAALG